MPKKQKAAVTSDTIIANLVTSKLSGECPELVEEIIKAVKAAPDLRFIEFQFSGSGDSGDINYTEYSDSDNNPVRADIEFDTGPVYDLLEKEVTCDWVNNEGGGGCLRLDLETMEMSLTSYYYAQTECDDKTLSLCGLTP